MQGGMVMPMLSYHATEGSLSVMVDPSVPQLTPLMISHPGDHFEESDPWYDALDPSRQGLAFSRRYGFVMDSMTDPLPAGTTIWLRKLSSSPGLSIYRYRETAPKTWEPIFGTEGSTNSLSWNGMMFHPVFLAPPGTGAYTANFEAFLADANTGEPVPGVTTGPFEFYWTVAPDGRPTLNIAMRIVIAWPASATNYVLESADRLPASSWTPLTNTPVVVDGQPAILLDASAATRFFRMSLAP